MAQEMGLLPRINEQSGPISARDLAIKVNSDELLIGSDLIVIAVLARTNMETGRLLRVLSAVGIGKETSPNTYEANEISQIAGSQGGQAGIKYLNELLFSVAARVVPYMREHGFKQFPRKDAGEMDPTQFTFQGRTMWEYLKDTPEMKLQFDTYVARVWFRYQCTDRQAV